MQKNRQKMTHNSTKKSPEPLKPVMKHEQTE